MLGLCMSCMPSGKVTSSLTQFAQAGQDRQPNHSSSHDHGLSEAELGMQVTCQWWSWSACCCSEMSCQCLKLTRLGIGLLSPCRACSQASLRCWK